MSKISNFIRETFSAGDNLRDAGLTTPEDIIRYDNIVYGSDPAQQSLDVYRPKAAEGKKLPVIVSVHGGGWVYGDKERYQFYCMNLAQRGFAVVNFTYRLAPENKYPASLEDTNSVFTWVLDNSEKYGFDTEHVFAVGDSAGAHNLGLYASICTNPAYAAFYEFDAPKGFKPTAIALNCGAYSLVGDKSDQTIALMGDFLPEHGMERELWLIDVIAHITWDYPPTFFMTSSGDFLQDQAGPLAAQLVRMKVPFVFRYYGNKDNILPHVFHCNIRSDDAKLCNDEECEFFRKFL
ncbi:MAG: alpha/beta hydrolase [Lachnospiraceae bacterium]|nr:alpha/beta hydrolase [Lachnospiraceae bacterium]MDE7179075.1 alpha/beta hydrolase [Lachnospiraceae bacterium]